MAKRGKRGKARGKGRRRLGSLGMAAGIGAVVVAVVVLIVLANTLGQGEDAVPSGSADLPARDPPAGRQGRTPGCRAPPAADPADPGTGCAPQ